MWRRNGAVLLDADTSRVGGITPCRVSLLSHTYVVAANRRKLAALSSREAIALQLIIPTTWRQQETGRSIPAEPAGGDPYEVRVLPIRYVRPAVHWYGAGTLAGAWRSFRPDVVHVEEEPWSLAAWQVAAAKHELGFGLSLFTWENLDRRLPWAARRIERFVLRRVDHLVAGNAAAAEVMRRRGYAGPVTVLPQHGVDVDPAPAAGCNRDDGGTYTVGFVGRLVPEKGVDLLLEAVARLGPDCKLLLVGEGPTLPQLLERARALGISERVTAAIGVAHAAVPDYLKEMDVLVLPSRTTPYWKEQFGHVLIEAMACGVPVVGSSSGEIPVVIGNAGLVFKEDDVDDLVAGLEALRDRDLSHRLAESGRARVVAQYSNDAVAAGYARVFRAVHQQRTGGSAMDARLR
jgi:glycosyltransferase involved in cell wall biosynthesis